MDFRKVRPAVGGRSSSLSLVPFLLPWAACGPRRPFRAVRPWAFFSVVGSLVGGRRSGRTYGRVVAIPVQYAAQLQLPLYTAAPEPEASAFTYGRPIINFCFETRAPSFSRGLSPSRGELSRFPAISEPRVLF